MSVLTSTLPILAVSHSVPPFIFARPALRLSRPHASARPNLRLAPSRCGQPGLPLSGWQRPAPRAPYLGPGALAQGALGPVGDVAGSRAVRGPGRLLRVAAPGRPLGCPGSDVAGGRARAERQPRPEEVRPAGAWRRRKCAGSEGRGFLTPPTASWLSPLLSGAGSGYFRQVSGGSRVVVAPGFPHPQLSAPPCGIQHVGLGQFQLRPLGLHGSQGAELGRVTLPYSRPLPSDQIPPQGAETGVCGGGRGAVPISNRDGSLPVYNLPNPVVGLMTYLQIW